jgi:translation initiation factor 1
MYTRIEKEEITKKKSLIFVCYNSIMSDEKSRLVYSTGKELPRRENLVWKPPQRTDTRSPKAIYVRLDRKGRGGKSVTIIEGFQLTEKDSEALLRKLKTLLGTGGALKEDVLEIQGDHRDAVIALLQDMGYKPKRAGG